MLNCFRPIFARWLQSVPHSQPAFRLNRPSFLLSSTLLLSAGLLPGQFLSPEQLNPFKAHQDGIQIYEISAFTNYLSDVPGYLRGSSASGHEIDAGGTGSIGWNRIRTRSSIRLQYGFQYENQTGAFEYRSLGHRLTVDTARRIGYRWDLAFSADGQILNSANLIFVQGALTQALDVQSSFADLTSGVLAGRLATNNDIAAMLTRSYAYLGPTQSLFLGDRILNATAQTRLSYRYSPRLIFHLDGGASRSQALSSQNNAYRTYLLSPFTLATAQIGFSYSLSPRSTLSFDVSSRRGHTAFEDAYTTQAQVSLGKVIGRRWFTTLWGGLGIATPVRTSYSVPRGVQSLAGGTIGFKTFTQTFAFSADRSVVDSYGLGPSYVLNTTGTWSWKRPGRRWSVLASVGQQRIDGTSFPQITTWQATGTFSRQLTRDTLISLSYAYLHVMDGGYFAALYAPTSHGVRVTFRWKPGGVVQ